MLVGVLLATPLAFVPTLAAPPCVVRRQKRHIACVDGGDVAKQAASLANSLRRRLEDAEEELNVEVVHSTKFLTRGDGLREDFARSKKARRLRLMRGAADNERALLRAMEDAEAAGLPRRYLENAIRVANALAVARAEIEWDYRRIEGTPPPGG